MKEDTIAAISTPFGESGIGVVRISGQLAERIASNLFVSRKGSSMLTSRHVHYGDILDPRSGRTIDEVLVLFMKAPGTYTKEDVVEIQCHGGYLILKKILELVMSQGARMAQPGEFTKRAFLNGRIDLAQAEAVIDLIQAKTSAALEIANQQLRGALYRKMVSVKEELIHHLALIEAHIDFPEDEIEPVSKDQLKHGIKGLTGEIEEWIQSYDEGRIFREGITCAIIGKTNVGKSSLLNTLLKEDRAIVTPYPGTTRDIIEEVMNLQGIPVRIVDTAGLRETNDSIEKEGVKRTKEKMEDADLVLLVMDSSQGLDENDLEIIQKVVHKKKIVVLNKMDLPVKVFLEEMKPLTGDVPIVPVSALKNQGISDLKRAIYDTLVYREVRTTPDHMIISNVRHKTALSQSRENLINAARGLEEGSSIEFIAFEIRAALESLGELAGETVTEDVLNRIFDKFCIGK